MDHDLELFIPDPGNPPTLLCRGMGVIDYFCSSRITCMVCWWTPRKIHGNWCRQADLATKITPCALCPMPYAPCLMPCALRPMPRAPHLNLFFWNNPPTLLCRGIGVIDYFCSSSIICMLCWWTPSKIHGT